MPSWLFPAHFEHLPKNPDQMSYRSGFYSCHSLILLGADKHRAGSYVSFNTSECLPPCQPVFDNFTKSE